MIELSFAGDYSQDSTLSMTVNIHRPPSPLSRSLENIRLALESAKGELTSIVLGVGEYILKQPHTLMPGLLPMEGRGGIAGGQRGLLAVDAPQFISRLCPTMGQGHG